MSKDFIFDILEPMGMYWTKTDTGKYLIKKHRLLSKTLESIDSLIKGFDDIDGGIETVRLALVEEIKHTNEKIQLFEATF